MDENKIKDLSLLAQIGLNEEEAKKFATQLTAAIQYFDQISKIDTSQQTPLVNPVEIKENRRNDVVVKSVTSEELLECAQEKVGNLYTVPPVI